MAYHVGQILFVILSKQAQVYPMMVVEEIVKRTLNGEETNYVLQGGSDPTSTVLAHQVKGEIFESAEEAKYVLTSRATTQIEKMVDLAMRKATEWYGAKKIEAPTKIVESMDSSVDEDEKVQVELPDGTIAYMKKLDMVG